MSVFDVDICTVRTIIGKSTGDCELQGNAEKEQSDTTVVAEIVEEVVENAMEDPSTIFSGACGIGDQLNLTPPSPNTRFGVLEKKKRLTNLVKNSKQMFTKFLTESKQPLSCPVTEDEEEIIQIIELDDNTQCEETEDELNEVQLCEEDDNKRMTLPVASGSSKTASFIEKCRTLKTYPAKLKEKKWNIGSKVVHFLRKHTKKDDEHEN